MAPPVSLPGHVTHYHRADLAPFLSLSDVPEEDAAAVLGGLRDPGSRRRFGSRYLDLRRRTERVLRERFVAAGGRPERASPHYFVLGDSAWFRGLYDDPREVVLPLAALPSEVTSVTLPDSVTALELGVAIGVAPAHPAHAGRVYRLEQIADALARHDPRESEAPAYDGHQRAPFDVYVEVQLWSDEPVRGWLDPLRTSRC